MTIDLTEQLAAVDHRQTAEQAGYMELQSARKDADCETVAVDGGVSSARGCCNIVLPVAGAEHFTCGLCEHIVPRGSVKAIELSELLSKTDPQSENWHGIQIAIENRAGTVRSGQGWVVTLKNDYGFIKRVMGMDSMELDCFIGNQGSDHVWILRITDPMGADDEDKVILGSDSEQEAKDILTTNYDSEWQGGISKATGMNLEDFKHWLGIQGASDLLSEVKGKPIAFDFDGTLAKRRGGHDDQKAGKPIHKVFEAVAEWRKRGYDPYVLTARSDLDFVRDWLKEEGLTIEVSNVKRPGTLAVVDDRAVDVENHDFKSIMEQIQQKVELSVRFKPLRDTLTPYWDAPVHKSEAHVDFRGIHSAILKHEDAVARTLAGGLRVAATRELARQAVDQIIRGKRAHALAFHAPTEIAKQAKPKVKAAYQEAKAEAAKETDRLVAGRQAVALDEVTDRQRKEEKTLAILLLLLEDRYTNFLSGAMREAAASQAVEIQQLINTGKVADAERELEAFANQYSDGKLETLASQTVREATRAGRADEFTADPRLAGAEWFRSAVLDQNTCSPCSVRDMTRISGPDEDLSKICEGNMACRCLPVSILKNEVAP